jgi:hydroxymethylbilane synthase
MDKIFKIGTRASGLALAQAYAVRDALMVAHGLPESCLEIVPMVASGDKVQDRALAELGGKLLWTKELDGALLRGDVDMCVHSMKDVETQRAAHFQLAAVLKRGDVRERLVGAHSLAALPQGAVFGTSSPRRKAQVLALRPDVRVQLLRGNVATRLAKLEAGEMDATLLAAAGLHRLGLNHVGSTLEVETLLPAPAQGAIGVECLRENTRIAALLAPLNDTDSSTCVLAERAFLGALGGTCHSALAAYAMIKAGEIYFRAALYAPDGSAQVAGETIAAVGDIIPMHRLAETLLSRATPDIRAAYGR